MMGERTFHPDTRTLLAYARALSGETALTPRNEPSAGERLAERLFVLDRRQFGVLELRTFGAELTALFGVDLRGRDFGALWAQSDQTLVRAFSETVAHVGQPGVILAQGETDEGRRVGVEVTLMPLRLRNDAPGRQLGLIQPLGGETLLRGRPVQRLQLCALHPPAQKDRPGPRLVVSNS